MSVVSMSTPSASLSSVSSSVRSEGDDLDGFVDECGVDEDVAVVGVGC